MCGIFGIAFNHSDEYPPEYKLKKSAQLLKHRGPDHNDFFADNGIGLVSTRLSIQDLSEKSNQPFWDSTKRYCLIYNGEIYNAKELRHEIKKKNINFYTTGDIEVLLNVLLNFEIIEALRRIEGMFTFALYDTKSGKLIIARDRLGIKSLFYYVDDSKFIFSSEIRAMNPWINFKPDELSIFSYLWGIGAPMSGRTLLNNIRIVNPGEIIQFNKGEALSFKKFFSYTDLWRSEVFEKYQNLSTKKIIDELDEQMHLSVKAKLVSDAPIGAFCSGGVDSALILAIAKKYHDSLTVFHANIIGSDSEKNEAKEIADHLNIDMKVVNVSDHDLLRFIPEAIEHYSQPFSYNPNTIPFLLVSKLANKHGIKSIITGEGSDELFLGYHWILLQKRWRPNYFNLMEFIKSKGKSILRKQSDLSPFILKKILTGFYNGFGHELDTLEFTKNLQNNTQLQKKDYPRQISSLEWLSSYHLRTLLHRNDSQVMAASVEARFPFLHSNIIEIAINLPHYYKIRPSFFNSEMNRLYLSNKWIVRKVAERYLPHHIAFRKKRGFPVSAYKRLKISQNYFYKSYTAELFNLNKNGIKYLLNNSDQKLRIKLLQLEIWANLFLKQMKKEEIFNIIQENIKITPEQ